TQLDGAIKAMGVMVAAGGGADLGTAGINISAADLTTLQASVQGIIDSGVISDPTQIAAMTQFLAITKANLDQLIAAHNRLPEVDIELRNIETRLMTISAMKPALQDGLNKATQGYKELESGKINMGTGLTNAQTQLTLAKSELDKATKEFETQRDAALKAADISGVLTADTISQLLTAQNFSMPAGSLTEGEEKYTVKVGDELSDITELENVTLLSIDVEGLKNIRLKDVANVKMTDNSGSGYAKINGNDGIILTMQKQSTFSTASVCNNVKKAITEMQKTNPELHITPLMDQGVYINIVINSVLQNLLMGGVLAVIILFLFLRDIRSTLIIGLSIPISLMFAVVLMYFSGVTLNIISLSGLALGVGMLVDNSIVSIENIYRLYSNGMDKKKAAVAGAKQISGAIIASTLTTVCVFLPIVFTTGITKQLFTDMGLTIAYSLLASLIIALTVVPTLSSMVLSRKAIKEHKIFDKFLNVYQKVLAWVLRFKPVVLVAVLLLFVYSVVAIGSMGTEFIPEAEGTQISATMTMPKGSKHEDLVKMSDTIIERISDIEDIDTIGAMSASGGGAMMGMGGGKNSMSYYILLDEDKKQTTTEIATDIQKKIKDLDCTMDIQTSNMDMSMLGGSGIEIVIKGKD
ncbi:MAG: efflux RND transporter permease subunit, partial [Oscillospiraceae bacterium]